jgi:hypothetical protein
VYGWVRNISVDGALVRVDGVTRFGDDQIDSRIEIHALPESGLAKLPVAGKLVRVFDVESDQYLALRFLDYLDEAGEGVC